MTVLRGRSFPGNRWARSLVVPAVAVACGMLKAGTARAHLVSTELGPFYDGAAHSLVSLQDLLTILGLSLLAAHGGTALGRRLILTLPLAWGAGVTVGFGLTEGSWDAPAATAAAVLVLGIARLIQFRVPAGVLLSVAALVGLARGVMNGAAARLADGQWLSVLGIACGVFVLGTLLTASFRWLEKRGAAVALRVIGSWVAAIGLLMLGWEIRN